MATSFSRAASTSNRRSANIHGTRSRVSSSRVGDHAEAQQQHEEDTSPKDSEEAVNDGNAERSSKRYSRDLVTSERRVERKKVVTREKVIRRSPVKESSSAANRGDLERQRKHAESPTLRKKQIEPEERESAIFSVRGLLTGIATSPWNPQATLIPHSSAPLATRISAPPVSSLAPKTLLPRPFRDMPMQQQETILLDDLLYVFMGYEGQYVRFVDSYNPSEEKAKLAGPGYCILPGLDPSLRDLTTSMLTVATHYSAIEAFVEAQSREEFGSVNHALCAAIRKLLKDYLILVAQLEMKVITDQSFTLHQMHLHIIPTAQSLAHLYALAQELLKKNSLLDEDLDESLDDFDDADDILERLREGGDLLPGSLSKKRCIGGNVLVLLTQRLETYSGDPAARTLLEMLLREASRPYVTMLNEWLHHGGIKDAHSEFLIGERSGIKRERMDEDYTDEYWEKRYYIRDREVPTQLEAVKEKILLAGKYLNVVRECGGVNVSKKITNIPRTFSDSQFLDNVNTAYSHANSSLLSLLLTKNSLRSRLRSLKHYFFLDRAEFFLYFLELSSSELRKPNKSVNVGKLQSLLDLVLRQPGSIAAADPFKEDVRVKMNEISLTQWLMKIVMVQGIDQDNQDSIIEKYQATPAPSVTKEDDKEINGFDALELDYTVPFPLSLVISRKTVLRYQLLFRYTLALRHLETMLVDCWSEHNKTQSWIHKSSSRRIELWKRRAWTLRARMLVFVQQMLFFATAEVIEPNWQKLMAKVDEAQALDSDLQPPPTSPPPSQDNITSSPTAKAKRTVDELMQDHLDMLDSCMKDLGLTQGKLLKIHAKLMMGCSMFATYTASLSRSLYAADPDLANASTKPNQSNPPPPASSSSSTTNPTTNTAAPEVDPTRLARLDETLRKYEDHFNRHLRILIDSLNYYAATETVVLLSLCARLTAADVGGR
jgi:gamma-tubulin complex component 2